MHTFEHESTRTQIHHNGDYAGEALVMIPVGPDMVEPEITMGPDGQRRLEVTMPCKALAEFSRSATLSEVVDVIEGLGFAASPSGARRAEARLEVDNRARVVRATDEGLVALDFYKDLAAAYVGRASTSPEAPHIGVRMTPEEAEDLAVQLRARAAEARSVDRAR